MHPASDQTTDKGSSSEHDKIKLYTIITQSITGTPLTFRNVKSYTIEGDHVVFIDALKGGEMRFIVSRTEIREEVSP